MRHELDGTGVKVATINPGPFRTGFNDRMYDRVDQWFEPSVNFSDEAPLREMQAQMAGDDIQLDPQPMMPCASLLGQFRSDGDAVFRKDCTLPSWRHPEPAGRGDEGSLQP